jgi:hypothetical protein
VLPCKSLQGSKQLASSHVKIVAPFARVEAPSLFGPSIIRGNDKHARGFIMGSTRSAETLELDARVQANQRRVTAELQLSYDLPSADRARLVPSSPAASRKLAAPPTLI